MSKKEKENETLSLVSLVALTASDISPQAVGELFSTVTSQLLDWGFESHPRLCLCGVCMISSSCVGFL